MTEPDFLSPASDRKSVRLERWLDWLWVAGLLVLLAFSFNLFRSGRFCAYIGTDFRGYYAAAQIARQQGFDAVYDQELQEQFQARLPLHCPDGSKASPLLSVVMPYLSIFLIVFVPLTFIEFTSAYHLWVILNLVVLTIYLQHFGRALGERPGILRTLQWVLCIPVFSNLLLGQMNTLLVICLGEFVLACLRGRRLRAGLWLAVMLIKPHTLILLLPALLIHKSWRVLLGFAAGGAAVLLSSGLLAGWQGVWASLRLAAQFAGGLIQTGAAMMNFRALALNLQASLPGWLAWGSAVMAMILVAALTLYLWRSHYPAQQVGFIVLILATFAATFAVTWHSHFYLLMLLLPLLLALDLKQIIPHAWRWYWMLGPPVYFGLLYLVNPNMARNWFGLGMLVGNLLLLIWSARRLQCNGSSKDEY
jgi:hypothetical protein